MRARGAARRTCMASRSARRPRRRRRRSARAVRSARRRPRRALPPRVRARRSRRPASPSRRRSTPTGRRRRACGPRAASGAGRGRAGSRRRRRRSGPRGPCRARARARGRCCRRDRGGCRRSRRPAAQSRDAARESAKLSVVMLAPNATSPALAPRKRAATSCDSATRASDRSDVANGPPRFAFDSRRYDAIASITESGTCVPPGASKNTSGRCRAVNRALISSTGVRRRATCSPARRSGLRRRSSRAVPWRRDRRDRRSAG